MVIQRTVLSRHRQVYLYEFEATLVHTARSKPGKLHRDNLFNRLDRQSDTDDRPIYFACHVVLGI